MQNQYNNIPSFGLMNQCSTCGWPYSVNLVETERRVFNDTDFYFINGHKPLSEREFENNRVGLLYFYRCKAIEADMLDFPVSWSKRGDNISIFRADQRLLLLLQNDDPLWYLIDARNVDRMEFYKSFN